MGNSTQTATNMRVQLIQYLEGQQKQVDKSKRDGCIIFTSQGLLSRLYTSDSRLGKKSLCCQANCHGQQVGEILASCTPQTVEF
jgi:hypothetical protein